MCNATPLNVNADLYNRTYYLNPRRRYRWRSIETTVYLVNMALRKVGEAPLAITTIDAGAAYYQETEQDIEPNGEKTAGGCDAIF